MIAVHWGRTWAREAAPAARNMFLHRFKFSRLVQDGSTVVGRIVSEEDGDLVVVTNPFVPAERTRVKRSAVVSRKPFPLSLMPPGLVNSLNEDELKDLLAYILSSGKADDARFKH